MPLKLVTAPSVEPVSLAEAKLHCGIDGSAFDDLLPGWITAAREYCEGFQNRSYCQQTWDLWLGCWPRGDSVRIPLPPLQSVTSIKYYDTAGVEATMTVTDYIIDDICEPGRVVLAYGKSWPAVTLRPAKGIDINFVAGYPVGGTEETPDYAVNVPQKVKQAICLLVAYWSEHREAGTKDVPREIEFAVKALLSLDRVVPV